MTETSADGSVTVTVNSGGVLTDLRITEPDGARIAMQVLATMRAAQARIADRMSDVMVADDPELRDRVLARYHDRFPEPDDPAGRPAVDGEQDDDTIMRRY